GRYRLFPRLALTLYRLLPADDYAELLRRLGFPEAANEAPQDPSPGTRDARTAVKAALRGP
ncbi:MAG: hypothetical protein ACRD02_13160, partial [Acidimicrobiia bacterium]